MKKRYFSPDITVAYISTAKVIAVSGKLSNEEIDNSDAFGSRGGSWDDEDDDY